MSYGPWDEDPTPIFSEKDMQSSRLEYLVETMQSSANFPMWSNVSADTAYFDLDEESLEELLNGFYPNDVTDYFGAYQRQDQETGEWEYWNYPHWLIGTYILLYLKSEEPRYVFVPEKEYRK
jgi:hypothetical protein